MWLTFVALVASACSWAQSSEPSITDLLQQADRIVVGIPEEVTDVPSGEQFQVEIRRVLRGSGQKGTLARISNPGEAKVHLKFEARKQYLFLLKKNPAGRGWINLGGGILPFTDDKISYLVNGKSRGEWALDEFVGLASRNFPEEEVQAARVGPIGKWVVSLSQEGNDFSIWLVDITKNGDKYDARLLGTSRAVGSTATLKSYDITPEVVNFVFDVDGRPFNFRGKLTGATARGNISVPPATVVPASMLPTEATNTKSFDEPKESDGRSEYVKAESFAELSDFVSKYPNSPLALDAYRDLIGGAKAAGLTAEKFSKLADDYLRAARPWGERLETRANVHLGVMLSANAFLPELASKYLDAAQARFTDETPELWKQGVQTERARLFLEKGERESARKLLEQLYASYPFQPEITWMLAREAESDKQTDRAIALYGELAALPMMERALMEMLQGDRKIARNELPSRVLQKLWQEKHGDTEKLSEYLDELFDKRLRALATDPVPQRKSDKDGTRVVLCELFTGSECPPCVGADAATTALEATYKKSELIVLRYHQHIPRPDPLANEDGQERFETYQGQGTPSMYVNGRPFLGAGGFMTEVPAAYRTLRSIIDPYLREKIDLKLDLSAQATDGKISLSATAGGLKSFPDTVRLRLALTEDKIPFLAGNGIRTHEMIVRSMPGGAKGISPENGKLAYSEEIDISRLKSRLLRQLKQVEGEVAAPFPQKPLDLKALHLVAFLQNERTGEVLQAAAIPVSGSLASATNNKKTGAAETPAKR